jgi:hypothetical protein
MAGKCQNRGPTHIVGTQCPRWISEQFDLSQTLVRKYYDAHSFDFIYVVGPLRIVMPNRNVDSYLMWYDYKGRFLKNTENLIPNYFQYVGQCVPQGLCSFPQWLTRQFSLEDYDIELFWHETYGRVYAIALKKVVNANIVWYDEGGHHLYTTICGWGCHSQEQRAINRNWNRATTFIDRCLGGGKPP